MGCGRHIRESWTDFVNLFFPRTCVNCGTPLVNGEHSLCLDCLCNLPLNGEHEKSGNDIERRLWVKDYVGAFNISYATAYLKFEKGNSTAKILHSIKYKGNEKLAIEMGRLLGAELKGGRWEDIDMLIPVPLHPKKLTIRGYNQSERICCGISQSLGRPTVTDVLIRTVANETQTHKSAQERWENVQGIFATVNHQKVEGKHIAIVDDVLTTGATIEACIQAFKGIKNLKISVIALANTQN